MKHDVPVIVGTMTKKFELCKNFLNSLFIAHPLFPKENIVVIDDTDLGKEVLSPPGFDQITWIPSLRPWSFSKNANLLIRAALQNNCDLFMCNDDSAFKSVNSIYGLKAACDLDPSIGILSPLFLGFVGNQQQVALKGTFENKPDVFEVTGNLCFTAVYIPISTLKAVGYMNEKFDHTSYGYDDDDYCEKVKSTGRKLKVAKTILMRHGSKDYVHSSTYSDLPDFAQMAERGKEIYKQERERRRRLGLS